MTELLAYYPDDWGVFERWCAGHGYRPFPSTPEVVLEFLLDPPVTGREVGDVLTAITYYHDAFYWHTNANPGTWMFAYGVYVDADGVLVIPAEVLALGGGNANR